ncbi:hypothetical protein J1N35_044469 [Gossypium stocksii]|uniref:Uncharacterized protein n=1 Tax=Gossypium stocksii TaxID=47602 RepID=A0A9D3U9F7_9ROSI|nr:hypothetical protein J1N35_044469 [Gossypium stocksii]
MSVEDLIVRLRIEEDNRGIEKRLDKIANVNDARANIVEVKNDFKKGKKTSEEEVENQHNKKIKMVRSDRGGEYVEPFGEYCA